MGFSRVSHVLANVNCPLNGLLYRDRYESLHCQVMFVLAFLRVQPREDARDGWRNEARGGSSEDRRSGRYRRATRTTGRT
jgi:hypothetical protein